MSVAFGVHVTSYGCGADGGQPTISSRGPFVLEERSLPRLLLPTPI